MVDAKATTRNNRAQCDNNLSEDDEIPIKTKKRKLRPKKTREKVLNKIKEYIQDSTDEEDDFVRKFDLDEKLTCERYLPENNPDMIFEKQASEITLEYFQRNDFETPILIKENIDNGLELKMPPSSDFWVDDVKQLVGPRRIIDVMNVETQEAETMSMKEWAVYFNKPERDRLLNLISLEFSHTKLDTLIDSPKFVKSMDWVDLVWPRHLKKQQKEGTNALQDMKYPKVQKYCLMSVGKCYTDFHIDFSGTSVWYHIFRGGKVFWLIPPTEKNIKLYEEWTLSGKQSHIFFGDTVEECVRVDLTSGNTFLIPTGWIHAVYTTEDSLVFGGNFLHSLGIRRQIRSAEVEVATKVGKKFRYPFFIELLWYVIIRYVHCLTGKNYLCFDDDGKSFLDDGNDDEKNKIQAKEEPEDVKEEIKEVKPVENAYDTETEDEEDDKIEELQRKYEEAEIKRKMKLKVDRSKFPSKPYVSFTPSTWTHLRQKEMDGLEYLINWLDKLPPLKKSIPEMLISPEGLLRDARKMLEDHKNDDQELAISGNPSLFWITKDFLNSTKQNRVKKPRKSKKVKNELATENGTSELTESVNFNNFSASLMQDSNNKINSGSTIKQSAIPTGLMSLIAQTGVNQMGNGQVMHQQQLQQQQPPSGFQSNNGVAVMQPAAQYGAPFRPIPRPAPMHHVAPQQTYMQPHMGPVHAQRMVYSHQPPNSMIVKVPHSYAQQAQALQVAPAATIMNHHPAYVQQTSYYAPNVHVQQQQQPQHPQQHLPQQQPQQSQQPQTQQQQQPPPPQPQQNHHYSVPNYGPSPGVNYYVRAAPQPQYQTPQYHYVHNTAGPAQPYPQTMHVAPQYQPQAIYVASQTQPTQVPHPQQHQYYTHTNGHVQTYAPVQQHPIQPQQPPAQQHLPPQQYHQYSYPSQY